MGYVFFSLSLPGISCENCHQQAIMLVKKKINLCIIVFILTHEQPYAILLTNSAVSY